MNLTKTVFVPLPRMIHRTGANHVEINVDHTAMQVLVDLDGGGVITIFPERTLRTPALVVLLRGAPCDELHAVSNYVWAGVFD